MFRTWRECREPADGSKAWCGLRSLRRACEAPSPHPEEHRASDASRRMATTRMVRDALLRSAPHHEAVRVEAAAALIQPLPYPLTAACIASQCRTRFGCAVTNAFSGVGIGKKWMLAINP